MVIKVHYNVFLKVTFPPWLENIASHRERIMEKTQKFQIVYAGPTNLCQHFTTNLARAIMMNKHSKTTSSFFVFNLSPTSR